MGLCVTWPSQRLMATAVELDDGIDTQRRVAMGNFHGARTVTRRDGADDRADEVKLTCGWCGGARGARDRESRGAVVAIVLVLLLA